MCIQDGGTGLVGVNSSIALSKSLVVGYNTGEVSIYDMRNGEKVSTIISSAPSTRLKSFDVHKHLAFAVGSTENNKLKVFSFETPQLKETIQSIPSDCGSFDFSLHQSEFSCALRLRNKVIQQSIDYST